MCLYHQAYPTGNHWSPVRWCSFADALSSGLRITGAHTIRIGLSKVTGCRRESMLLLMLSRRGWTLSAGRILSYRSNEVAGAYSEVALLVSKAVVVLIEYIISGRSSDMNEFDARHIDNTPIPQSTVRPSQRARRACRVFACQMSSLRERGRAPPLAVVGV
jgi:hypothetical protein